MNPRKRILHTLKGQVADRVPLVLPGFSCSSYTDIAKIADHKRRQIAERVIDETDFRVQVPSYINRMLVTPPQRIQTEQKILPNGHRQTHGAIDTPSGELTFVTEWDPQSQTSWQVKYPVEDKEDIKKIASIPWEFNNYMRLIDIWEELSPIVK